MVTQGYWEKKLTHFIFILKVHINFVKNFMRKKRKIITNDNDHDFHNNLS